MTLLKIVVTHHHTSGQVKDDITNTLYAGTAPAADVPVKASEAAALLQEAWGFTHAPGVNPLDTYLATELSRTMGRDVEVYAKEPGERLYGSPVHRLLGQPFNAAGTATGLPSEVALVGTWRGDRTDVPVELPDGSRPLARITGHNYFGPFTTAVLSTGAGLRTRPSDALRDAIRGWESFVNDGLDALDMSWLIVHAADSVGWSAVPVVQAWVDNEWDMQTRRGGTSTDVDYAFGAP